MRRPLLAGNWKMFKTTSEAEAFAKDLSARVNDVTERDMLICPPYVYIPALCNIFGDSPVKTGAQNVYWEPKGAFTGEISALMLKDIACEYVIIGHSERRQLFGETDETVNKRINASIEAGLKPILCVGETLTERDQNKTFDIIGAQLKDGLGKIDKGRAKDLVIAYEPVWAIGTGKTATPDMAQEVHAFIRNVLTEVFDMDFAKNTRILYGGSVKPDNIDELMAQKDIDGALVGGASLDAASFERIIRYKG